MQLSYWEYRSWFHQIDYTVVGSGIVGLSTALHLRKRYPKARILILERGTLPQGASTRNAGFACFGSISEILSDLSNHSEDEVFKLVNARFEGIQVLRTLLGDRALDYKNFGGHEIFLEKDTRLYDECRDAMPTINELLNPIFKKDVFVITNNKYGFEKVREHYITQVEEGQLDTGKMMKGLLGLAQKSNIQVLNSIEVKNYHENQTGVVIKTDTFEFETKKLLICTNGFASELMNDKVTPARAQVLVTEPIKELRVEGAFHFDRGYYYFRNIDNRILLGGGRNLDFQTEQTTEFGQTEIVQKELERLLRETILPGTDIGIEHRWSGIMGVGKQKKPIVKQLSNNVYCGVRLGGMGVAIGSLVGKELADLL